MPSLKSIRFQKYDKFQNPVFIASSTKPDEKENYEVLKEYAEKLEDKDYGTYLPIFHSDQYNYATVRYKKNDKHTKLLPRATYNVDYKIKTITKDQKIYVNCFIERVRLVSKPPVIDEGEELEL